VKEMHAREYRRVTEVNGPTLLHIRDASTSHCSFTFDPELERSGPCKYS